MITQVATLPPEEPRPRKRGRGPGFAGMTPEKRSEIAGKGGKRANELGHAYKWDSEAAARAGRKGGSRRTRGYKRGKYRKSEATQ